MSNPAGKCPDTERLEAYARQELPPGEAGAVEEHFMGCEACWRRVRLTLGLRAALATGGEVAEPGRGQGRGGRPRGWLPLLAAAALVVATGAGFWLSRIGPTRQSAPPLRGAAEEPVLEISLERLDGGLEVRWETVPGARLYRVEVAGPEGAAVFARETEAPTVRLEPVGPDPIRVRVLALDELRQELAASPWREVGTGGPGSGGVE